MSIEIRFCTDGECHCGTVQPIDAPITCRHWLECDWGTIQGQPRPEQEPVSPLCLVSRDAVHEMIEHGPNNWGRPSTGSVTLVPIDEPITEQSRLRMFFHLEYGAQTWTWELFDAHWWDHKGPQVYVGRWPD